MTTPVDWNGLLAENLRPGDTFRLKVVGVSMRPLLQPGDWVIARAGADTGYELGDLLVFQNSGHLVTHRLVGHAAGRLLLKGDALRSFDAPVAPQDVLGRVVAVEHLGLVRSLAGRRWTDRLAAVWSRVTGWLYQILFFWRVSA
jgi:hypothetical protein